ncbi:Do family serine endopeptidase [Chelatococcus asaccharovorans]|uniref:Do family serine endopeptidase n=1 Tax=Chelatococcus asaccharovorans TaxID=28210 RepID=UPI00224C6FE6|nr:Do family serine endopeptidase [Chelatococcus asaccharovorans]CAH1666686.1 Periplasmic serine endoprotease DegP-like [Chelatococcus asaccharovorans]CAH1681384.1 Periplasmic serine endoprotease DegP-like [Chelatococcus asaccharovorans]
MLRTFACASVLALLLAPLPAAAQQRAVPDNRAQVQFSLAPVVKQVTPAVVNVYGTRVEKRPQNPFFDDPFFRRFFGDGGFGVPQDRVQRSLGSGVIVEPSGLVITNNHVIENMTEVRVALGDKREFEADIVLRDPRSDLAVLRIKGNGPFPTAPLGSDDTIEVGDFVIAIGNPFGVGQTVTQGIVSALARTQVGISDFQSFIQTDAAINPGNSGGPLVDASGHVIGINTAIFSRSGGSMGIGFAVPAAMVRTVLASAKEGGKSVRRPWFGARLQVVSADIAESMGMERPTGALVVSTLPGSPAGAAGLKSGDVIVAVDGRAIEDPDSFGYRFATRPLGGRVAVTILRGGKRADIPVELAAAPERPAREALTVASNSPLRGATIVNLSPAVAEELSLQGLSKGVAVQELDQGSTAERLGFQTGDVVLAVNGSEVETTKDLDRVMRSRASYWQVTINRKGQVFTTMFGG